MSQQPPESLEEVIKADGRYPLEAYAFLQEGFARAVKGVYGEEVDEHLESHVTGQQLCLALGDLGRQKWGMLAATVVPM